MLFSPSLLVAIAAVTGPAMITDERHPIELRAVTQGDVVELIVLAQDKIAQDASYRLELTSEGVGGQSKTVQSGARKSGQPSGVLLRSRVSTSGRRHWNARLYVTTGQKSYTMERSG